MVIFRPGKLDYVDLETTLDNVSSVTGNVVRFLFNGSQYVIVERNESTYETELNYWNTNGDAAASYLVSKSKIFDMCYDSSDGVYYAVRLNTDSDYYGTPGADWGATTLFFDDFEEGSSTDDYKFDEFLWVDSLPSWYQYTRNSEDSVGRTYTSNTRSWASFVRNPDSKTLDFKTRAGIGIIRTALSADSDFQAYLDIRSTALPHEYSVFSLRMIDTDPLFSTEKNNLVVEAMMLGDYDYYDSVAKPGKWRSAHITFTPDNSSSLWSVFNFRLIESVVTDSRYGLDTNLDTSNYSSYQVLFYDNDSGNQYFKVDQTSPGSSILASGVISESSRSFDLVDGPFAFTIMASPTVDLDTTNLVGTSITFNVNVSEDIGGGSSDLTSTSGVSGFKIGVGRAGTNLYARRDDDGDVPTLSWNDINVYNAVPSWVTPNLSVELYGDCSSLASTSPDIKCDQLLLESASSGTWSNIHTLTIEALDTTGAITTKTITNSSGEIISRLNAINRPNTNGGDFDSLRDNGIVSIATDHGSSSDGSIFVLVKRDENDETRLYRYKKSVLPIEDVEGGETAFLVASGTLDRGNFYRGGSFGYSSYTGGELSYATDNWTDVGKGFYFNTLLSGTLSGTRPRHSAWLSNVDHIAWNIDDYDSLYGVTVTGTNAGKVRLFNLSPITAAFCNVRIDNRALDAGTGDQTNVVAEVMNAYGEPLSGKVVNFTVSAGDGSVSPISATTNVSGEALTTYTVGSSITTSTITAAVNI